MSSNPNLVFVLGMHRSGTSVLTGALQALGAHVGTNLMPANKHNPRGFFEDLGFVRFNDRLLKALGRNWHEMIYIETQQFETPHLSAYTLEAVKLLRQHVEGQALTALKDPRFCLLLPFWREVCEKAGVNTSFILAIRDPRAVAQSLFLRDRIPPAKSGWIWLEHTISALEATRGEKRIVLDYHQLMNHPDSELTRIAAFVGSPEKDESVIRKAAELIDGSLNHARKQGDAPEGFESGQVPPLAVELYQSLLPYALQSGEIDLYQLAFLSKQFKSMTGLGAIYTGLDRKFNAKGREVQELQLKIDLGHQQINALQAERGVLVRKVRNMENSLSWRITSGLRWIADHPRLQPLWRSLRITRSFMLLPANYRLLSKYNLFDAGYYLGKNPDVAKRGMRPMLHYLLFGWREARSPHPMFNAFWYLWMNPSLRKGRDHPLIHYCKKGAKTGKLPRIHFDTDWYGDQFPESGKSGSNPLFHYVRHGLPAVRKFIEETGIFDAVFYSQKYPDIPATGQDPLEHFLKFGLWEHRDPSAGFCHAFYLHEYPDVKTLDLPPFLHFAWLGHRLGYNGIAQDKHPTPGDIQRAQEALQNAPETPFFSVIMPTWNRGNVIKRAVDSLLDQSYKQYELIIIDDGSTDDTLPLLETEYRDQIQAGNIHIISSPHAGGSAARNLGLQAAKGNWIAYLDSDNKWREHYLLFSAATIIAQPDARTLYSEIRVNDRPRDFEYVRRKTFSWADLYQANFIDLNIFCHHIDLFKELGGFDAQLTRLVDWDLILRQTAKHRPVFIPFTLADYFLCSSLSNASHREDFTSNRDVVRSKFADQAEHIMADERRLENTRMFDWEKMAKDASQRVQGLTSIIIPFVNNAELVLKCLDSIRRYTPTNKYEVILVDNASSPGDANNIAKYVVDKSEIEMIRNSTNLNYALGNNVGFSRSKGEYVVLLNNDTEVTAGWLEELIPPLRDDETIGATGPRLLYGDGTVQCAGIVFNDKSKIPYHIYRNEPGDAPHVNRKRHFQALTGACFAMRAIDFARLNGLDPSFINGCEDIDLCFRISELGKKPLYCPGATVYHHEGLTAGRNDYVLLNRKLFILRWGHSIVPDDQAFYRQDGFAVSCFIKKGTEPHGDAAAYTPRLFCANDSESNPSPPVKYQAGIISIWHIRGISKVAKQVCDALDEGDFETHVLARWESHRYCNEGDVTHSSIQNGGDDPSPEQTVDWARKHYLDVVIFMEVHPNDWKRVRALKNAGFKVMALEMLDVLDRDFLVKYRVFDGFVCIAHYTYNFFRTNFPEIPAILLPWGIPELQSAPRDFSNDATNGRIHFVHVAGWGGINNRKNTDLLIRAFHRASPANARLHIYTQVPVDKYGDDCASMLRSNPGFVLHQGTIPDIRTAYEGKDMLLWPSKREGLGLPILEALVAGLPVLISDGYMMKQWIVPGEHGIMVEGTPQQGKMWLPELEIDEKLLANTISAICKDPDAIQRMKINVNRDREVWLWTWQSNALREHLENFIRTTNRYGKEYAKLPGWMEAFESRRGMRPSQLASR